MRDRFFNVPARKKFLKRASTEMSHVTDAVHRLAMANRKVAFKLASTGRVLLDVPSERPRLARILGKTFADHLHPIPEERGATGFVSAPELSKRTARSIYTFVNGRYVRDRTIQHAITDGYRTLLERGRYPVVILFLEIDSKSFDVNMHPKKIEVRFSRTGDIHRLVSSAINRTLAGQPWLKQSRRSPRAATSSRTSRPPRCWRASQHRSSRWSGTSSSPVRS